MDLVGTLFENKYQVIDVLGKGGMSTVYLAKDINVQKLWAIKEVNKNFKSGDGLKVDLMAETNILKRLDHSALPRIVDIIDKKDNIYVVLDFIDGVSLDRKLQQQGVIDEETVIDWAKQICDVLNYLHQQKPNPIIYRDMKPGNLMLTGDGRIKLIDFGIAREYKEDSSLDTTYIGTKGYAAPEQYGSYQTDARTDIYSLGVTLYHLTTGKGPNDPPFEIKQVRKINPSLSEGIEIIIDKCTHQDPILRYQSVKELLNDLENIHKLNSKYKDELRKKQIKISSTIVIFILSLLLVVNGIFGVKNQYAAEYNQSIDNGNKLTAKGNTGSAVDNFKNAIAKDSNNADAYIKVIAAYLKNNEQTQSIDFIETYITSGNSKLLKNDNLLYEIGMAYFENENYSTSYKYFTKIKNPDLEGLEPLKYYRPIAQALGVMDVTKTDEIVKSVKKLEDYVQTSSDVNFKINAYITLAGIYRDNPEQFSESNNNNTDKEIITLEKANTLSPDKSNIVLYQQLGQAYYNKATQLKPDPVQYNNYLNKALENYKNTIAAGSQLSDSYYKLGIIYKYLGNMIESEKVFLKEIQMFPDDYKGYMELALLYQYIQQNNVQKDYSNFSNYYKLTMTKNHNNNDVDFINLQQKYNDLKSQGLIK
ncbi:serine/threonine-protein kinase [Clostridium akagii]|uniref:serine/threonine-protein kinase n=1 Tax=Clostridium akagii TaxID=91623 RepID=UPI0009FD6DD0|nr:serine/threonine-protein kinase [Clostridium akagii]